MLIACSCRRSHQHLVSKMAVREVLGPCKPTNKQNNASGEVPSLFSGTLHANGCLLTVAFLLRTESFHKIDAQQLCSRYEQRPMKLLSKEYSCRNTHISYLTIRRSLRIVVKETTVKGLRPQCASCQLLTPLRRDCYVAPYLNGTFAACCR